jgi:hypothetical protein
MCILDRMQANTHPKETLIGSLPIGAEVMARIVDIEFSSLRLQLTSKSMELQRSSVWEEQYLRAQDPYYHVLTDKEVMDAEAAKRVRS